MKTRIRAILTEDHELWDRFVSRKDDANVYQLSGWQDVISNAYGHKPFYLAAIRNLEGPDGRQVTQEAIDDIPSRIVGILPLFQVSHFAFGNQLVSVPFFDHGGLLADDTEAENALLDEALEIARVLKAQQIELRSLTPMVPETDENASVPTRADYRRGILMDTLTHKVRMLLELSDQADTLFKSFKSKLRSQIRRPMKAGLSAKVGGVELMHDFYRVFCINMRDLGSPVHSKQLMLNVLERFDRTAKVFVVYQNENPLACALGLGFKDTFVNPWASSLRKYNTLSPNMLLYWTMLAHACDNGYRFFDFGRSTVDEGTFRFKKQWGAKPHPMYWQRFICSDDASLKTDDQKDRFSKAAQIWRNLPLTVTRVVGPHIRKYISL